MNQYGVTAQRHWERWLPERFTEIRDPASFFSDLGEEAARQIADLTLVLAGDDPPGEDYLVKVGRLNMARLQAEEIVLPDLVLLPPEPGAREDPDEDFAEIQKQAGQSGMEMPPVISPGHPLWEQVNAEQEALLQDS